MTKLPNWLALCPVHDHCQNTTVVCLVVNGARSTALAELSVQRCEQLGRELLDRAALLRELAVMRSELSHADKIGALRDAAAAAGQNDMSEEAVTRLAAHVDAVGWPANLNKGRTRIVELAAGRIAGRQENALSAGPPPASAELPAAPSPRR